MTTDTMTDATRYSMEVAELFGSQAKEWPLMAANYEALDQIKVKKLQYFGYYLKVQYNPARIISSSAKVDKKTIQNRACFLCSANRPQEQRAIEFGKDFLILINPFPIFPGHLTIAQKDHVPQLILENLGAMLELAKALPDYTIFYNGPRCGASAPDHFHFQAGNKSHMPLDYQIDAIKTDFGRKTQLAHVTVWKIDDLIRRFLLLESNNANEILKIFDKIYKILASFKPDTDEPDLNIHCSFGENGWKLIIFPRAAHRPWQYFADGEDNILFSPASVDLGGLLIVPLEKDFNKIDRVSAWSMLRQVGLNEELFNEIKF